MHREKARVSVEEGINDVMEDKQCDTKSLKILLRFETEGVMNFISCWHFVLVQFFGP